MARRKFRGNDRELNLEQLNIGGFQLRRTLGKDRDFAAVAVGSNRLRIFPDAT
jgi:hypothetical protein